MKKFLFILLALFILSSKFYAQALYAPITTTNYNMDGVAETTASSITTSGALDGSDYVMHSMAYSALYSMSVGLPNNGLISSTSKTFQLQPYTQNNVLFIMAGQIDSLIIVTPAPYNAVSVIGFATEGQGSMNVTLRFTDNTTQVFNNISLADWFTGTGNIFNGFGRTNRTSGTISAPSAAPNLYPIDFNLICANRVKNLKSIKFSNTATNARLCIMGASGASNSTSITTTVNPVTCQGGTNGSATVTATGGTPPFTFTWSSTPPQFGNTLNNVPIGVYNYTISDAGACTITNSITIASSLTTQPPIFVSSNTTSVCLGNTVAIAASGVNTFSWSNGSNAQIQILTPTATTNYSLIGYSSANCLLSGSINITVFPVPSVSLSSIPSQLCINSNSFAIIGSPLGGTLTGGNLVIGGFSPSMAGIGTYTFNYVFTSTDNCSADASATTIVNALPIVSLNLNATPFCNTAPNFNLSNTGQPTGGVYSGTGVSGTAFSPSVAGSGNHVIMYTYTDLNNCVNSSTAAVSVSSLAAPSISIAKTFYCNNASNVFVTTAPSNGTFTGVGISQAGLFSPTQAGIGTHTITYSIKSGPCNNSSNITVTVSACTGLNEIDFTETSIYPNPNNGLFFIELNTSAQLSLFNSLGQLISNINLSKGKNNISNLELSEGIYIAVIKTENSIIQKQIIVTTR